MKKYLKLAATVIRHGSLGHSGQNFHATRVKSLENLQEFIPKGKNILQPKGSVNNLRGQLAFIRSSFRKTGGHLTVQPLAYIRIPKAANTSVSYAMLVKKYPELKERLVDETQLNFLTDVNLLQVKDAGTENFFTVVRNPFARLVSVYRDFFETRHPEFIYADYLFGILPQTLSFAEFVNRISRIPDRLKDQHIKPQHLFVEPYEACGIEVRSIQLENPLTLESFLTQHGMALTHRNKSGAAYDYRHYYTAELLAQVYILYQTDILKFGYESVYQELKAGLNNSQN